MIVFAYPERNAYFFFFSAHLVHGRHFEEEEVFLDGEASEGRQKLLEAVQNAADGLRAFQRKQVGASVGVHLGDTQGTHRIRGKIYHVQLLPRRRLNSHCTGTPAQLFW